MFEKTIYNILIAESFITDNVSDYNGLPSIFSDQAPEDVSFPYIVFDISETTPPDSIINRYNVYINYYNYGSSSSSARVVVDRINELLDQQRLSNDRLSDIRIRRDVYSRLDEGDPRAIHYNIQMEARATRKKWMQTTL
jgi:hypothetical protein